MLMSNDNNFLSSLEKNMVDYVDTSWSSDKSVIQQNIKEFINESKQDLEKWTLLLVNGMLSKKDYEWLVESKADLARMIILKNITIAKSAANSLIYGLLDKIINTAFNNLT
jgi:hypothetical protein